MGDTFHVLVLHKLTKSSTITIKNVVLKVDVANLKFTITSKQLETEVFPISLFKQYKVKSGGPYVTLHVLDRNEKNISLLKFEFREGDPNMESLAQCLNIMIMRNKEINGSNTRKILVRLPEYRTPAAFQLQPKRACSLIKKPIHNTSPSHVVCYESEEHQLEMITKQNCSLDSHTFTLELVRLLTKKSCLQLMKNAELVVDIVNQKLSIYYNKRAGEIVYPITIFKQFRVKADGTFVHLFGVENNECELEQVVFEFQVDDPQIIQLTNLLNKLFQKVRARENDNVDEEGTSAPKRKMYNNNENDEIVTLDI
ncbi:unnamed protein product [Caenorhabditis angaria]|uniref:Uncharacterized protein n=1 Tax=Caenorhabditis angaria TaxID=860376 RepID=A0A9P1MV73_9PELO|nr:unnamed protein product [Caenorhabditis angaria]